MNHQKTPLSRTLPLFTQAKALAEIRKRGGALPGEVTEVDGQVVTVKFQVADITLPPATMPLATCEYIRKPIQVGDRGVAIPCTTFLGGVSGLGTGIADTSLVGNLSALIWLPVANTDWSDEDPDAVTIVAPNGVVLKDTTAAAQVKVTPTSITLQVGSSAIVITSSGITIMGKDFLTHKHTGVQTGGGVTGNVQ
jgi:hypothetical protein